MLKKPLPVTEMFQKMVDAGQIVPAQHMEELRFPGEFSSVPSITTYGTSTLGHPLLGKVASVDAQLEQRAERNFSN
jgi:hypothetical protein